MAISAKGAGGTGVSSTSSSSFTLTTATTAINANDIGILVVSVDNRSTADGQTSDVTSITGGTGVWSKLGEYTNSPGGVAADGACCAVWRFVATGSNAVGTVFTINLSGNATDKVAILHVFTVGAGNTLAQASGQAIQTQEVTASNGFGSSAYSSLGSLSRLWFRGLSKEANTTTAITVSTNFTAIAATRSRNNAAAMYGTGEFRINTSTGETSNPTLAVSGDTASVFLALEEVSNAQSVTGNAISSGSTLFAGVVALAVTGATIAGSTLNAGTVSQTLTGATLSASTLNAGSAALSVTGGSISGGSQLFAGTASEGGQSISGGTIISGSTLNAGTVAFTIQGATIAAGSSVNPGNVAQSLAGGTIASSSTLNAGSVSLSVGGATIPSGHQLFAGQCAQTISGATVASGSTLSAGSASQTLTGAAITSGSTLFAGTASQAGSVTGAFISGGSSLNPGSVALVVQGATIASGSSFSAGVISEDIVPIFVAELGAESRALTLGEHGRSATIQGATRIMELPE